MASPSPKTYTAGCHCGQNRFKATLPKALDSEDSSVVGCNCTICTANGYLLTSITTDSLEWEKGGLDEMKHYTFNKGNFRHYFCTNCGTSLLIKPESGDTVAVNVSDFSFSLLGFLVLMKICRCEASMTLMSKH
jgi:hypothetical protein